MSRFQNLFPVTLQGKWHDKQPDKISPKLLDWLLDPTSLTARLKNHCAEFSVEVLGQEVIACPEEDACDVVKEGEQVLLREVLLMCDGKPHVFARSILPLTSLTGEQQALAHLGNKPLGHIIFNNPSLERKLIQTSAFSAESSVGLLANKLLLTPLNELWGRRSLFSLEAKPFVVAEVFLSPCVAYL